MINIIVDNDIIYFFIIAIIRLELLFLYSIFLDIVSNLTIIFLFVQ